MHSQVGVAEWGGGWVGEWVCDDEAGMSNVISALHRNIDWRSSWSSRRATKDDNQTPPYAIYNIYSTVPYICMYIYHTIYSLELPRIAADWQANFTHIQLKSAGRHRAASHSQGWGFQYQGLYWGTTKPLFIFGIIKMEVKYHSEGEYVLYGDLFKKPCFGTI